MLDNYLDIMIDSLQKKAVILLKIEEKSKEQSELIKHDEMLFADLDKNMDEKSELIDELIKLDDGFEALYSNIKKEIEGHKDEHKDKIKKIQGLIEDVTALSVSIQALEQRNKAEMEVKFANEKKQLQHRKTVSKVAYNYYTVSNKIDTVNPQFMDKKK